MADPVAKIVSQVLTPNAQNPKQMDLTVQAEINLDGVVHTRTLKYVLDDTYVFHLRTMPSADDIKAQVVAEANKLAALRDLSLSLAPDAVAQADLVAAAKGK